MVETVFRSGVVLEAQANNIERLELVIDGARSGE